MDRFAYSLNGTVVVYGFDNFDGLMSADRDEAVLLPKRIASRESELDDSLENSFCTMPRITFEDLRNSFNDSEFDIADTESDADDDFLRNDLSLLSPDYYANSKADDEAHDVIKELSIPQQQRNCSIPNDAFILIYTGNNCASTHFSQPCLAINILSYFLFYNLLLSRALM